MAPWSGMGVTRETAEHLQASDEVVSQTHMVDGSDEGAIGKSFGRCRQAVELGGGLPEVIAIRRSEGQRLVRFAFGYVLTQRNNRVSTLKYSVPNPTGVIITDSATGDKLRVKE